MHKRLKNGGKSDVMLCKGGQIRSFTKMREHWMGNGNGIFEASVIVMFKVDGKETEQLKSHGPLTFLEVHKAGYMVPTDQTEA